MVKSIGTVDSDYRGEVRSGQIGIAHYDYRLLRGLSYEQAFNVMRGLRLSYAESQEMFRRVVFNVVVRNQDDLSNHRCDL